MPEFLIVVGWLLFLLYAYGLIDLSIGWNKKVLPGEPVEDITILVPLRNEADNLPQLLSDLQLQTDQRFEVLLIDDHSEDEWKSVLQPFLSSLSLKWIENEGLGKKKALAVGIRHAQTAFVICLDADCHPGKKFVSGWKKKLNASSSLLFGPVFLKTGESLGEDFQALEFTLLMSLGGSSVNRGKPVMANAANMAIHRDTFLELNPYQEEYPGGDDIFLIHKFREEMGAESVSFVKDRSIQVTTAAESDLESFYQQRKRWAAKWRLISGWGTVLPILVFIWNLFFLAGLFFLFQRQVLLLIASSVILEVWILARFLHFARQLKLLPLYFPLKLIYPIYVLFFGITVNFGSFRWKNRNYRV